MHKRSGMHKRSLMDSQNTDKEVVQPKTIICCFCHGRVIPFAHCAQCGLLDEYNLQEDQTNYDDLLDYDEESEDDAMEEIPVGKSLGPKPSELLSSVLTSNNEVLAEIRQTIFDQAEGLRHVIEALENGSLSLDDSYLKGQMEDQICEQRCDERDLGPGVIHTLVFAQAHMRNNCLVNITPAGSIVVLPHWTFQCLFMTTWAPIVFNQGRAMQYQKTNGSYSCTGMALWTLDNAATGYIKKYIGGSRDQLLNNACDCCTSTDNPICVATPTTTITEFSPFNALRRRECEYKLAYIIDFMQTEAGTHINMIFLNGAVEFKGFRRVHRAKIMNVTADMEATFLATLHRKMVSNLKGGGIFVLTLPNRRKVFVFSMYSIGSMMGSPLPSALIKVTHLLNMHDLMNLVQLLEGIKVETSSVFLDMVQSNYDVESMEESGYDRDMSANHCFTWDNSKKTIP